MSKEREMSRLTQVELVDVVDRAWREAIEAQAARLRLLDEHDASHESDRAWA